MYYIQKQERRTTIVYLECLQSVPLGSGRHDISNKNSEAILSVSIHAMRNIFENTGTERRVNKCRHQRAVCGIQSTWPCFQRRSTVEQFPDQTNRRSHLAAIASALLWEKIVVQVQHTQAQIVHYIKTDFIKSWNFGCSRTNRTYLVFKRGIHEYY